MLGKIFGRRRSPKLPEGAYVENRMPWEPDGSVIAGFAVTNVVDYVIGDLKGPRGVHVESLMTLVGALAGFSAQHAIWETVVKTGKLPEHGVGADFNGGAFVVVTEQSGEKFYFGDLLNSFLVPQEAKLASFGPGPHTLWGFVASAVMQCGREPIGFDAISDIFANASKTIGTAFFGEPRLPKQHQPAISPRRALNRAWPKVRAILARDDAPGAGARSLWPGHWPIALGVVARKLVLDTKDALDPTMSMRILFEAAIPMSKVDPTTVP